MQGTDNNKVESQEPTNEETTTEETEETYEGLVDGAITGIAGTEEGEGTC